MTADTSASHHHPHPLPDFAASEARLRRQLLTGAHRAIWEANFGTAEYRHLRALAARAGRRRTHPGPRVYILPGIMGSKLGTARNGSRAQTLLWIDPEEIQRGALLQLALPAGRRFKALGVMVLTYLKLKLTLEIAGFDVQFHPYDWRLGIDVLGRLLHERLQRDRAKQVMVVAHSMGGLIARVAQGLEAAGGTKRIARLILLGTPNYGSFAPVMALRGVYPAVRKVATLDPRHSAETLTRRVFNTFPGLHHMLPAPERFAAWNLYDPANWPAGTLGPRRSLLRDVARMRGLLAAADGRVSEVIGIDQDTITGMGRSNGEFEYFITRNGDGTVPVEMARLPGARTYYVRENHASLPANSLVCSAVLDLLRTGATRRLARRWRGKPGLRPISESALRQTDVQKFDWAALSVLERRLLLQGLVLPMPTGPAGNGAARR